MPIKGPKISSFCHAPHPHVQVTDMSFTTVMNAEPVLKSAIVNGHHFRALLDTGISFMKRAFVALGKLDYIHVTTI